MVEKEAQEIICLAKVVLVVVVPQAGMKRVLVEVDIQVVVMVARIIWVKYLLAVVAVHIHLLVSHLSPQIITPMVS